MFYEIDFIKVFIPKLENLADNIVINFVENKYQYLKQNGVMLCRNDFSNAYPYFNLNIYYIFNDDLKNYTELQLRYHWHIIGNIEKKISNLNNFFELYDKYDYEFFYKTNKELINKYYEDNYIYYFDINKNKLNKELVNIKTFHTFIINNKNFIKSIYDFFITNPDINIEVIGLFNKDLFRTHVSKRTMKDNEIKEIIYFYLEEIEKENRETILNKEEFYNKYDKFDLDIFKKFNKKYEKEDEIICITDYHSNNLIGSLNDFLEKHIDFNLDNFKKNMLDKNLSIIDNLVKFHLDKKYRRELEEVIKEGEKVDSNFSVEVIEEDNFDWEFYLDIYPDLEQNGIKTKEMAYNHWITFGKKEGRKCNLDSIKKNIYIEKLENKYNFISNNKKKFNILIRTCHRPNYFKKCINSVLNQNYDNFRVIVSYDNKECLNYLEEYNIEKYFVYSDSNKKYKFNLYCNFLLDKVEDGWIIFLDDDDIFTDNNVLSLINENINLNEDFLIWKFLRPDKEIYPQNLYNIKLGEIDTTSFCFNSKYKDLSEWNDKQYGDYYFINNLLNKNKFNIKFINEILTKTIFDNKISNFGESNEILDFKNFISKNKIKQIYISKSLEHLKERILRLFNLQEYKNNFDRTIFFGIYLEEDFSFIENHNGLKFIMLGGSDVPNITRIKCNNIISISKDIKDRLNVIGLESILINFNLVDKNIFKPMENLGNRIYVYDGRIDKDDNKKIYNTKLISEIKKKLPNYSFIHSSKMSERPNRDMVNTYCQCFIGLRLTNHDGNANTVQEFESMKIPIIHNQSEYGLKWTNIDDIISLIKYYDNNKDTLFIMGNGPSLSLIMDDKDKLNYIKKYDTFGLNASYKYYKEYDFNPTYFGCFDYAVNVSHKKNFDKLIINNKKIKKFFFIGDDKKKQYLYSEEIRNNSKFQKINFLETNNIKLSSNFDNFINFGSSGANAVQIGMMLGYKKIILLGCDCNYQEKINGVVNYPKILNGLKVEKKINNNPNYWKEDYQEVGDIFKKPNVKLYHLPAWEKIFNLCPNNIKIYNYSPNSKIPYFIKIKELKINQENLDYIFQEQYIKCIKYYNNNFKFDYNLCSKKLIYLNQIYPEESIEINEELILSHNLQESQKIEIYYSENKFEVIFQNKNYFFNKLKNINYNKNKKFDLSIVLPLSLLNVDYHSFVNFVFIINNFLKIRKNINIQICITHTEKNYCSFIDKLIQNENISYIFVKNPYNFNLGYNRNLYKYISNSQKILFCDIDISLNINIIQDLIDKSKKYDIVKPYDKRLIHISEEEKKNILVNKIDINKIDINKILKNRKPKCLFTITGGITLFDENILIETGYYEEFNSYGSEDRCLDVIILEKKYSIYRIDNLLIHLYHPKSILKQKDEFNSKLEWVEKYYNCLLTNKEKNNIHENCNHNKFFLPQIIEYNKNNNCNLLKFEVKPFLKNYVEEKKILFIMGNGPSLKEIMDNPEYLKILKNNHTFGLNSAYRAYEKYDFYPTYFGCFDYVVNESHKESFEKLVLENNPIKEFYFIGNGKQKQNLYKEDVMNNNKFKKFNFIHINIDTYSGISKSFYKYYNPGSSGANALQIGIMKGYKKIVLLGCDCNYIEEVSGVKHYDKKFVNRLELTENLNSNPNYWFPEYQQKGDRFNLPGNDKFQMGSWKNMSKFCPSDVIIKNVSTISKIPFFDKFEFCRINNLKDNFLYEINESFTFFLKNNIKKWYGNGLHKTIKIWHKEILNKSLKFYSTEDEKSFLNLESKIKDNELYVNDAEKLQNKFNKENNFDKKFISFILIIKDRFKETQLFLNYLSKLEQFNTYAKLIIIEDNSQRNININKINKDIDIDYYLVNSETNWSRTKLINYGLSKNDLQLSLITDVDFIFPINFIKKFRNLFKNFNFNNNIIGIPVFETNDVLNLNGNKVRNKNDPCGHYYVFDTEVIIKNYGYNFDIEGHGFEEREFLLRNLLNGVNTLFLNNNIFKDLFILHLSHSDISRGKKRTLEERSLILIDMFKVNKFIYKLKKLSSYTNIFE
jgi:hypothetical protein